MPSAPPAPVSASRLAYLDGLRGVALVLMVVNHTARWWIEGRMTWARYELIYVTLTLAAPTFLFLVGFCLPLSRPRDTAAPESLGALARRLVPRGARIVLAGLALNLVVFRDESILSGGVLQTIGLAIIAMAPATWLLRFRPGPWVLLAIAVAGYVAFVHAYPALTRFVVDYPLVGLVLFYDFPPWPWLSLVLIGLVLGSTWLRAHRASPDAGARYLAIGAVMGVTMVAAFFVYDWWAATPMRFGTRRDFILNNHWTPRGAALLWVLGMVLLLPGITYWAMERRRWRLRWLVILGQTAMFLYFFHQIIAFTLVKQRWGWHVDTWPQFWLANAVFVAGLVGCGWAWSELRAWRARRRRPALAASS
jgi:peptidoglycan/LPS O-acetylase OafA/YrhL